MNPLEPFILKSGAIALILGATYIGGCVRGSQTANDKLTEYRAQVEAAGRSAQATADERKKLDEQKAKASDESYSKALVALGSDIERLRRARTSTNYLPPVAPDTRSAETGLACFARDELEQAIQRLDAGLSGIVEESDKVRLRLSTAIEWAKSR